jgi:hypothetical protein
MYHLVYASKHERGNAIWKSVIKGSSKQTAMKFD